MQRYLQRARGKEWGKGQRLTSGEMQRRRHKAFASHRPPRLRSKAVKAQSKGSRNWIHRQKRPVRSESDGRRARAPSQVASRLATWASARAPSPACPHDTAREGKLQRQREEQRRLQRHGQGQRVQAKAVPQGPASGRSATEFIIIQVEDER